MNNPYRVTQQFVDGTSLISPACAVYFDTQEDLLDIFWQGVAGTEPKPKTYDLKETKSVTIELLEKG